MGSTKSSDRPLALLSSIGPVRFFSLWRLVRLFSAGSLVWLAVDGGVRPKGASAAPTSSQNTAPAESRELVDRLLSQVEALKSEVRELTEAQQQPAHAIEAIEAERESRNRAPPVYWYSDPAALSSGTESGPEPRGVVPLPRRPASPRPTLR